MSFPLSATAELSPARKPQKGQTQNITLNLKEIDKEGYEVSPMGTAVGRKGKKQEGSSLLSFHNITDLTDAAVNRLCITCIARCRWQVYRQPRRYSKTSMGSKHVEARRRRELCYLLVNDRQWIAITYL
jgi:hypothetical protein